MTRRIVRRWRFTTFYGAVVALGFIILAVGRF